MQVLALGEAANAGGDTQREPVLKDPAHPAENQQKSALQRPGFSSIVNIGVWGVLL